MSLTIHFLILCLYNLQKFWHNTVTLLQVPFFCHCCVSTNVPKKKKMLGFCTVLQGQVETWNMRISTGLGTWQENMGKTFWSRPSEGQQSSDIPSASEIWVPLGFQTLQRQYFQDSWNPNFFQMNSQVFHFRHTTGSTWSPKH